MFTLKKEWELGLAFYGGGVVMDKSYSKESTNWKIMYPIPDLENLQLDENCRNSELEQSIKQKDF